MSTNNTTLNETYELLSNKETVTEIVTSDGTTLNQFCELYNNVAHSMTELCVIASKLAKVDRKTFRDYVVNNLSLSASTISVMIKAGDLYNNHTELLEMNYTKVYELQPVNEQLDEFVETVGGYEALTPMTQKEIRGKVERYLKEADEENEIEESEGEESEGEENEVEENDPVLDDKTIDGLQFAIDYLSSLNEGDELDADDVKSLKYITETIKKVIKEVK